MSPQHELEDIEYCECFRCGGSFPYEEMETIRFDDDRALVCVNCNEEL
jgi:hypothetical protein